MDAEQGELRPGSFRVARTGYDRGQVDAYLGRLESGDESAGEPVFALVRDGFHTRDVDAYIEWVRRGTEG
ncbi:DivIVA domain-containing protein [Streptomyces sp. 184]|uniref:DivIVA domain-containing protein n=1 Tax=Streptomyces sp. 184 TaxID=1827526 RepID=UPI003891A63B